MKSTLAIVLLTTTFSLLAQSKKELRTSLEIANNRIENYEKSIETKDEIINEVTAINNKLRKSMVRLEEELTMILPHLNISEGFPEAFYPLSEDIGLYNEVYSSKQEYRRADTSIVSRYNNAYFPSLHKNEEPDTVLLLGIIDTTLTINSFGVIYGTVPVLYKNKIRYTTLSDLRGSHAASSAKNTFKKMSLIEEFGEEIGSKIYYGEPWVGMTSSELYAMFGVQDRLSTYNSIDGTIHTYTYEKKWGTYVIDVQMNRVTHISKF